MGKSDSPQGAPSQEPLSIGDRLRELARNVHTIGMDEKSQAAIKYTSMYTESFINDEQLHALMHDTATTFITLPFSGVTEALDEGYFHDQLSKEEVLALEMPDETGATQAFVILRRLQGENFNDVLHAEFGETTVTDSITGQKLEQKMRDGLLYVLVEIHSSQPSSTGALIMKIAQYIPPNAHIVCKILHGIHLDGFHKFNGNAPAANVANNLHMATFGSAESKRKVGESEAILQFGVYAGEMQTIQAKLELRGIRESRQRPDKKIYAATRFTRRRLGTLLVFSAALGTLAWLGTRNDRQPDPAEAPPPPLTPDELLSHINPGKNFHAFSKEKFAACKDATEQRAYLQQSYIRVSGKGRKSWYVFPSNTISYCELVTLEDCPLTYARIIERSPTGDPSSHHVLLDTTSKIPVRTDYPAHRDTLQLKGPNGEILDHKVNVDFLKRVRSDARLQELLSTPGSLADWEPLLEILKIYHTHFPNRFPTRPEFWRAIVESNQSHRPYLEQARGIESPQ